MGVIGQLASKRTRIAAGSGKGNQTRQGWWWPWLIALVIFVAAWLIGLARGPVLIDIGSEDRQDLIYLSEGGEGGFFAPEKQPLASPEPSYDETYRWTSRTSFIDLPWPLEAVPLKATLRASAQRPNRNPDQTGTILSIAALTNNNSTNLGQFPVPGYYEGRDITFQIPVHLRPALDRLKLRFDSSEVYQPGNGDVRRLSAIFFSLKLEPDYAAFGWKGWLASLFRPTLLALLSLCTLGLASFFTRRQSWQLISEGFAGLLLLGSLLGWPLAAEPFYAPWVLILAGSWLLFGLAHRFAAAAPNLPAPFVYAATILPLLPFVQLVAGRQDLTNVNPGSVALVLYSAALLINGLVYFGRVANFETIFMWTFLGAAILLFGYNHWRVFADNIYRGGDFRNYYIGLLDGQPLYDLKKMAEQPGQAVRMPPAFGVLFWPFVQIFGRDVNAAIFGWRIFNELLLLPILYFFWKIFGKMQPGQNFFPAILFLTLSFTQISETIAYGQLNIVLLFGLALTSFWVYQKRDGLAGIALALPVWVKLIPIISGFFFLLERRWRGLAGLVAGTLLVNGLTIAAVGWDNVWFYFSKAIWAVNDPELGISNQSWWGIMGRLMVNEVKNDFLGNFPKQFAPLGYLGSLLGLLLTVSTLWKLSIKYQVSSIKSKIGSIKSETTRNLQLIIQLQLGVLTLLALWMPPFSWMHYIVPGLVGIMAMLIALNDKRTKGGALLIFGLAYALLAYGGRLDFFFVEAVGLARLGSSYRFMATFALWGLNLWLLWQEWAEPEQAG